MAGPNIFDFKYVFHKEGGHEISFEASNQDTTDATFQYCTLRHTSRGANRFPDGVPATYTGAESGWFVQRLQTRASDASNSG